MSYNKAHLTDKMIGSGVGGFLRYMIDRKSVTLGSVFPHQPQLTN